MTSRRKLPYTAAGRLPDVFALVQVLALDQHSHRSESGLTEELQGLPQSGASWTEVARQHPEFFRVRPSGDHVVSLLARHVTQPGAEGRAPLEPAYVHQLLKAAVEMHDREVERSNRWRVWIPVVSTLLGGALALGGSCLARLITPDR